MSERKHPTWLREENQCGFCNTFNPPSDIRCNEVEERVEVAYACTNPKCSYLKFGRGPSIFTLLHQGMGFIEVMRKYQSRETGESLVDEEVTSTDWFTAGADEA